MNRRAFAVLLILAILAIAVASYFLRVRKIETSKREAAANISSDADARTMAAAEKRAAFLREWNASHKPKREGANAADIYREAYNLFDALSDDEKKMLRNPREEIDADKAAELFKKIQPIMELMRKAGDANYCDWGLGKIKFDTPMTHIQQSMDLGRVALWSAGYRIASDPGGALDDIAAQRKLGRSLPDTLIGALVETSMNSNVTDLLNANARSLDSAAASRAIDMMRDNFYPEDIARAMQGEADAVLAQADSLNRKISDDWLKMLATSGNGNAPDLHALGYGDASNLSQALRQTAALEKQLIPVLGASDAEYQAKMQEVQVQLQSNAIGKMLFPSLDIVRNRVVGAEVQNAMLGAGLSIIQNGPAQIGAFVDPSTKQPFFYTPTKDGGFELRSPFQLKGKPVTMRFPSPTK